MSEIEKSGQGMREESDRLPILLLGGAALGALVAIIAVLLRRPRAHPPAGPVAVEAVPEPLHTSAELTGRRVGASAPRPVAGGVPQAKPALDQPGRSTRWPTATKYVVGVILFLAVIGLLVFSRSVIPTVILAALIAFVVTPFVRFFQRKLRLKRGWAVAITYLLVVVALALIVLTLLPATVSAINSLLSVDLESIGNTVLDLVDQASSSSSQFPVIDAVLGPILDSLRLSLEAITAARKPDPVSYALTVSEAGSTLAEMVGRLATVLGPLVSAITTIVFMLLISVYLSLTTDEIRTWWPKLIPPGYEPEISRLFGRISDIWSSFLRGQLTLMIFIGTAVYLGNLALGNRNALLLGIISGFLELIPNIGPAIALIPGVLMALIFGSSWMPVSNFVFALIVLAFYLGIQVLENQFVVPKMMGDALDLPPLVVILGVFVGGATIGILGVFLAAPAIATGVEIFGYLYNKILEPPPATGPPETRPDLVASMLGAAKNLAKRIKLPSGRGLRRRQEADAEIANADQATGEAAALADAISEGKTGDLAELSSVSPPAALEHTAPA